MSKKKPVLLTIFIILALIIGYAGYKGKQGANVRSANANEILHLEVNGVILNGKNFLKTLKKYSKDDSVKAIVIDINSPGGAVGPSQEMYYE
ncbi:MAG: signal peptide peptidase SppA, partial [Pseudobdellovibrio sp.]